MTNKDYQKILHEIKNHIAFINSSLQFVEKSHPEIKTFAYWNDSMEEISSLKKMLIELSSARLSNDLNLEKTSMDSFLPKLIQSCAAPFDSQSFHCQIELKPCLPKASVDPERLKRAFFNLMKNSYEAMEGVGTVYFHADTEGSFLRLNLTDCGGGISPEYYPKLFTPFETTKTNGTGLGLMITKQIIEAHGGRISVTSRPSEGCTFSVYLPCF